LNIANNSHGVLFTSQSTYLLQWGEHPL